MQYKAIAVVVVVIALAVAGWFIWRPISLQHNAYLGTPRLTAYVVGGAETTNGAIIQPFLQDGPQYKFLNILLAGRWIVKNMPVSVKAGVEEQYAFHIFSLDIRTFEVESIISATPLAGSDFNTKLPEAQRLRATVTLAVLAGEPINCLPALDQEYIKNATA